MTITLPTSFPDTAPLPDTTPKVPLVDNRIAYLGFALAYILGHGGTSLTLGADPLLDAPSWLPMIFLGVGLLVGTVAATVAATRSQRGLSAHEARPHKLLGLAWIIGFLGLFLAITGLTAATGDPGLQTLLWPSGSALIVGLVYLAEGAMRRDTLHYTLGALLIVIGTSALLLPTTLAIGTVAVCGGTAYVTAAILDHHRRVRS
nr:ABC transporter permease [Rhodococcus sp. (in: high G+C Gram-positive bacteria)]